MSRSINIDIDVDIDDIIYQMSSYEKEQLLYELLNDLPVKTILNAVEAVNEEEKRNILSGLRFNGNMTPSEVLFLKNLSYLSEMYLKLSKEDEEIIEGITKKY